MYNNYLRRNSNTFIINYMGIYKSLYLFILHLGISHHIIERRYSIVL